MSSPYLDGGTAAVWFEQNCPYIDVVHLDAAHEYENVLADIRKYWKLLRPGGILLGDDYSQLARSRKSGERVCCKHWLDVAPPNPAARRAAEHDTCAGDLQVVGAETQTRRDQSHTCHRCCSRCKYFRLCTKTSLRDKSYFGIARKVRLWLMRGREL